MKANLKIFTMSIKALAENFSLPVKAEYIQLMHDYLNFTEEDLKTAVNYFMTKERLFKMPSVAEWKKAVGIDIRSEVDKVEESFIRKVSYYLSLIFVSSDEKRRFNESLSDVERKVLSEMGGISELWCSVHNDNYSRSMSKILSECRLLFKDRATEKNIKKSIPSIPSDKVNNLLNSTIKKLN